MLQASFVRVRGRSRGSGPQEDRSETAGLKRVGFRSLAEHRPFVSNSAPSSQRRIGTPNATNLLAESPAKRPSLEGAGLAETAAMSRPQLSVRPRERHYASGWKTRPTSGRSDAWFSKGVSRAWIRSR